MAFLLVCSFALSHIIKCPKALLTDNYKADSSTLLLSLIKYHPLHGPDPFSKILPATLPPFHYPELISFVAFFTDSNNYITLLCVSSMGMSAL